MTSKNLSDIISSRARLKIADLLSTRPRTLKELADITGISVQAVLKHLGKLQRLGVLHEARIKGAGLAVRKLYSIEGVRIGDFSQGDLTIVKLSPTEPFKGKQARASFGELESLAEDNLLQRRRIREQARKLGRMIDGLVEGEDRLNGLVNGLRLSDDERLMVRTFFTEESMGEAERSLVEHYGLASARRAIDAALGKVGGYGK
jgi:DNA-binding transcriptional ArsR family regulator